VYECSEDLSGTLRRFDLEESTSAEIPSVTEFVEFFTEMNRRKFDSTLVTCG
jgi:hypothetical protein